MNREQARLRMQNELDACKTAAERNRLGQFATPPALAAEIVHYTAQKVLPFTTGAKALEPSCGTGSFLTALSECAATSGLIKTGIELDPAFAAGAQSLWKESVRIIQADFLNWSENSSEMFDLLVANPPYVRHHHLKPEQKARYSDFVAKASGQRVSGLSGLYVYFILGAAVKLKPGAVASWLVPAEFMSVNYGSAVRDYLATKVTLERVHVFRADDLQFDDALVTSCVVTYRNAVPQTDHEATFTFGSSFASPSETRRTPVSGLRRSSKWLQYFLQAPSDPGATLGQYFTVRRGIATGCNSFFIRPRSEFHAMGIPDTFLRPILPSPRYTPVEEVLSDEKGWPSNVDGLALLDCTGWTADHLPAPVCRYLENAPSSIHDSYLVKKRFPWYAQEQRNAAPIVCTYMGRGRGASGPALRFIRNRSRAIATNSYLMLFPKGRASSEDWLDDAWIKLSGITAAAIRAEGREYGGGLSKIEPKELSRVVVPGFAEEPQPVLF